MKKTLLFGIAGVAFSAVAEVPAPVHLDDSFIYALSPNGKYAVSQNALGLKIYDLARGTEDEYFDDMAIVSCGIGNCVSDNGIVLGTTDETTAQYWKDGEWYDLPVPASVDGVCLANAITPDGGRICGSLASSDIVLDGDALMQVPAVWYADGDGYAMPVVLPYPEYDFSGRVPQYVTATDMSADGKTIIGQVQCATGMSAYPIIYKEGADGKWTYEIVNADKLSPEGAEFPVYPGDSPDYPVVEDYKSAEEEAAYNAAMQAWVDSGYDEDLYPNPVDFLNAEEKAEYEVDMEAYQVAFAKWVEEYNTWFDLFFSIVDSNPQFVFNSMRLSPDGKYFGGTVQISIPGDMWGSIYNAWVGDVATGEYTRYTQFDDLNLTYLANEGIALASTSVGTVSQSYVLSNGMFENMYYWMSKQSVDYAAWMQENMVFGLETYDWETGDFGYEEIQMNGRATSTPNLETMALTVQNVWDYMTDAESFIFDVKAAHEAGVNGMEVGQDAKTVIYDLTGRRLEKAAAPGIYIVNGEKKVVR